MADVKWIKLKVGMFDGMSFKKIKRAEIGGVCFRDKLTAVWFELMDFAGRCNHNGAFIDSREIPFKNLSDIAMMIDREEDELKLCMNFFINEGMVSIIDDVYMLSAWNEYQNTAKLAEIREYNRLAKQKQRAKEKQLLPVNDMSRTNQICQDTDIDIDKDKEEEIERDKEKNNYQLIADMYNDICISFPRLTVLSDKRKKSIKARLNTYSIEQIKEVFTKAESSDFLKGSNSRDWQANFDWLMKDSNFAKVLDGNYDNKGTAQKPADNNEADFLEKWSV